MGVARYRLRHRDLQQGEQPVRVGGARLDAERRRHGDPPRIGAVTEHPDDWLNAIANGYGIALAPESSARYYQRPGVVFVPVLGVSPSRVGIVWDPADDANPVVQDFVRSCLRFTQP
jgi:DNA-binding transcriptional LysR family regulator